MSLLNDYRSKRDALRALQEELTRLENDEKLKKELAFEEKLRALLNEHGKSARDVISLLEPGLVSVKRSAGAPAGKTRALRRYTNPFTGEVVETKGANHKTLNAWREQHGQATVDSWKV